MMSTSWNILLVWMILSLALGACDSSTQPGNGGPDTSRKEFSVLVFSRTAAFRHESITAGIQAVRSLGTQHGFRVEATEDAAMFTDDSLARFAVVVFLNTTGNVLDTAQQSAFERFIRMGKGFVGIHSATDTEYDWPWYGGLVGTYFEGHPPTQNATAKVVDPAHPSTDGLPFSWARNDEWYNFATNPSINVDVLIEVDETTYTGGAMGEHHPITWCHQYSGGRAWYTAMGHTIESYSEPLFLKHLYGGIKWAAGQ